MLTLCLVTELDRPLNDYLFFLEQVIQNGVSCVQLRDKKRSIDAIYDAACQIKALLKRYQIPLIINDHLDLALAIDADGIHLGQEDIAPELARAHLGPNKSIGLSIETLDQLHAANQLDCLTYIAASAVFPSVTKTDCKTIWGLSGLKTITQQSNHPVVAIGGISINNVFDVIQHGAAGVAVVSAIHTHPEPATITQQLAQEINRGLTYV